MEDTKRAPLEAPRFVDNGQDVIAPYGNQGHGIRCKVVTAAGDHARVANDRAGFDRWVPLHDLRVEPKVAS